ncbi:MULTISPECIES: helix-turn-helix transcriptional regulator [unclassified Pseudomonas]|uniref:helix-turn-helix transcriptional regulator n=1 Tax=unclassified Pseudomonas TaxID=196821 RepID=UPI002B235CA6|nr:MULTISPECIES: helix-turn-helix domain-containing protein [unclassified Pseudomonas]MEB0005180.1 helix-turn-helix domain-containing protein [Pseudomonas sp. RTB2]MEB0019990.1 helix-turn-helix domain-containing protein [Pseudomonas sp. RTB3]MEB0271163.1 helix-turn-helix domain-containing protein [Pseudomonas sp. 5B4]
MSTINIVSTHERDERPLFIRVQEAARLLGVSISTIYRLVNEGELQLVKLGKRSSAITRTSLMTFTDARHGLMQAGL